MRAVGCDMFMVVGVRLLPLRAVAVDWGERAVAESPPFQRSSRNAPSGHHDRRITMATIVLAPLSAAALRVIPAGPRA